MIIRSKSVYLAIGINIEGKKEVPAFDPFGNQKSWRGRYSDRLCGRLESLQRGDRVGVHRNYCPACIVHMVSKSMRFFSWKDRKALVRDLKQVFRAGSEKLAFQNLETFEQKWGAKYASMGKLWRRNWEKVTPFLAYPPEIRRVIYTTNAIESLHSMLRKVTQNRGSFPSDEACAKLMYLALKNASAKWNRPMQNWGGVVNQLLIMFEDPMPVG